MQGGIVFDVKKSYLYAYIIRVAFCQEPNIVNRVLKILFLALLLTGVSFAKFVAVLETVADSKDILTLSERQYLTNMLREQAVQELPAELNFTIMTRENIMMMLPPGKSIEDCEGSCLAETGKNIAADYVAQARIGKVGSNISISAELYETAGSKLVASFNGLGADVNALMEVIKTKSPEFFRKARGGATGIVRTGFDGAGNQTFVVNVTTNPQGAALSIDGRPVRQCTATPCQVMVDAGEHRFVAVLDHHEDAEGLFSISGDGQEVSLDLVPRYGTLTLDLAFPAGGTYEELKIKVDGELVPAANKVLMDPGTRSVEIAHRCYNPVSFKVGVFRDKEEVFKESLSPVVGGISLKARSASGEERSLSVLVNGEKVGMTPFTGSVPVCAKIAVVDDAGEHPLDVKIEQGQVAQFEYVEPAKETAVADAVAIQPEVDSPQPGESVPTNVEQPEKSSHLGLKITFGVASLLGFGAAIAGEIGAKHFRDKEPDGETSYKNRLDTIDGFEKMRGAGLILGGVGLVAFGLTFVF